MTVRSPLALAAPPVAPVREHVVRNLREAIVTGVLAPGQKLVEAKLCEDLGVSRASLREALRQLEAERLIQIVPFKGPTVADMTWSEASQIYEVRELLEGHAAFLFAELATDDELAAMREALAEFDAAVKKGDARVLVTSTRRFYDVMLSGCRNQVIEEFLRGLNARISLLRSRSMSRPGRAVQSAKEMRAMFTALAARKPEAARKAAMDHVRKARKAAQRVLTEGGEPGR